MTKEEIMNRLTEIYREVFDDASISLSEEMTADDIEDWDSLTHLRLIMQIEQQFQIKFTTGQIKNMDNVGALMEQIQILTDKKQGE